MRILLIISALFLASCTATTNYSFEQLVQKYPRGAPILPAQVKHNFIKGAYLASQEEAQQNFYHFDGSSHQLLTLLKMQGFNTIALKLEDILALKDELQDLNFKLNVLIADNEQPKDIITTLAQHNIVPNMIQINANIEQDKLKKMIAEIHESDSKDYKIVLNFTAQVDLALVQELNIDIVAINYQAYDSREELGEQIKAINKEVVVYGAPQAQVQSLRDLIEAISNTDNGIGFFYHKPQQFFDQHGRLVDAIKVFNDFM